jgi:hypothetical protein
MYPHKNLAAPEAAVVLAIMAAILLLLSAEVSPNSPTGLITALGDLKTAGIDIVKAAGAAVVATAKLTAAIVAFLL